MSELMIVVMLALAFAAILLWLLHARQRTSEASGPTIDRALESALPKHYRFFPQIRQALSAGDNQYLREMAPPHIAQKVLRERRAVAQRFLRGLHEDFSNLHRLARMVAALSPVVSRKLETDRLLLSIKFEMLYVLVWLRLSAGTVPLPQIEHLTEMIGRLALRMEQAMAEINALSVDQFPRELNA